MIPEWKEHLEKSGAEFDDAGVASFGNIRREISVALTGNIFADLSQFSVLSIQGDDAEKFLQGQLTNDINHVTETSSQFSGYCNPKGRLLATFRLFKRGECYYLSLPSGLTEAITKKLRMYVIASKVIIEDVSDTFVHLGLSGDEAEQVLGECVGQLPGEVHGAITNENQIVLRVPGILPNYEILTTVEQAKALWEKLDVQCAPVGAEAWRLLDIQAGIPIIYPQTSEAFVPQMTNLQLVDGVSFKKGCFPGQEVVARMQYLGKLKRHMVLGRTNSEAPPSPGDEIFSSKDEKQAAGKIVSAASHPDGGYLLLAVAKIASTAADVTLHLGSTEGSVIELLELPYAYPSE